MDRLRVMQVTHDLGIGGLPRVVATLSKTLDSRFFEVSVLCLNQTGPLAEELEDEGIHVLTLPGGGDGPDYWAFRRVASLIRELGIEILHTHNTQPFIDGGLGGLLARVDCHVHTDHARQSPDKRRYVLAERWLSRFTDAVVGVSTHTAEKLASEIGVVREKITTICNGIEDVEFKGPFDRAAKRAELGIPEDALVIGVGVRLAEQKGLRYLIRALPNIKERLPTAVIVIAGYGPLERDLKEEARRCGVAEDVNFLGPRLDMPELLRTFDVYALPSIWEGLPMVVLEAMAAGCPVVASDVGGVASAVEDGVTGKLVRPRRPQELAEAIVPILGDPETRRTYGEAARARYREKFTAEVMTKQYEALYSRVARASGLSVSCKVGRETYG